jgi:hypothetical protein
VYFPFGFWSFDDDGLLLPACMHATELWISLWLQSKQIKTEFWPFVSCLGSFRFLEISLFQFFLFLLLFAFALFILFFCFLFFWFWNLGVSFFLTLEAKFHEQMLLQFIVKIRSHCHGGKLLQIFAWMEQPLKTMRDKQTDIETQRQRVGVSV